MKRNILIGVCVATLLMLVTPSISAVEYKEVEERYNTIVDENNLNRDSILETLNTLKKEVNSEEVKGKIGSNQFVVNLFISLLLAFLGTIFGIIFGPLLALLIKIVTAPAVLLAKFISSLLDSSTA